MSTSLSPTELAGLSRERRPLEVFGEDGSIVELLVPAFSGGRFWAIACCPTSGRIELLSKPWGDARKIKVHGIRPIAPPIDLGIRYCRGARGRWGLGDLAVVEALAVCHWWDRPVSIDYQRAEELGKPARAREGRIARCLGERILVRDEERGGEFRTLLLAGIESVLCLGEAETRPGWTGTEYAAGGSR